MLLLKQRVSVCPGDEGHPPVAPLPLPPTPHLGPPLALLPVHAVADMDGGGGMGGDPGPDRGQDGVPGLTPGVEEGTEGPHPGGDVTGHDHGPMTETESETGTGKETETEIGTEIERGTGTGTGTGDDTQHADVQGKTPQCLPTVVDP